MVSLSAGREFGNSLRLARKGHQRIGATDFEWQEFQVPGDDRHCLAILGYLVPVSKRYQRLVEKAWRRPVSGRAVDR
ncbi:MAG: hypothetical protein EXQ85_02130 [Alphaproteobacteria bacterium]|nr:hypothetical protein [Alphaproteobacteria bacterium]